MKGALRVLLTADPELPVPPRLYGGIERVIALLADGLTARGHDVALVAHPDSQIRGRLEPYARRSTSASTIRNAGAIARAFARHHPDVVHSFGRMLSLAPLLPLPVPKVMSYQRAVTPRSLAWGRRLSRGRVTFVACSHRLIEPVRAHAAWRVIYNAVDPAAYTFASEVDADAPLVFLGRLEHIKGPDVAIRVARQARRRLVLAGNIPNGQHGFFDRTIRPFLDGDRISYVGPVDDRAKSELLSRAAALLMPIQWEEPFGIVMAEALACGTPIIGLDRGAVPEVVTRGVTGFVCRNEDEMTAAVPAVPALSRTACRLDAEARFSQRALVDAHEALYREAIAAKGVLASAPGPMASEPGVATRGGR